jgi:phage shock protein PspC (stress-responsive transcriptional regulator)
MRGESRHTGAGWLDGLERPEEGRLVAGVCAGIARSLDLDPALLRIAAILLALAWGIGILLYLLLWVAIPRRFEGPWPGYGEVARANLSGLGSEVRRALSLLASMARAERDGGPHDRQRRRVAYLLIGGGLLLLLQSLGLFAWLGPTRLVALAIIAVGASFVIRLSPEARR